MSKQIGDPGDCRVMRNSGGETRKPHDFNTIGKSLDASHGIVQCNGVAVALTHHHIGDSQFALRQHVERGQRVANRSQIAADY